MRVEGRVRFWSDDDGCGVIDSDATPGGCWAGFPDIDMAGFKTLSKGARVTFIPVEVEQDGYSFRAEAIVPLT